MASMISYGIHLVLPPRRGLDDVTVVTLRAGCEPRLVRSRTICTRIRKECAPSVTREKARGGYADSIPLRSHTMTNVMRQRTSTSGHVEPCLPSPAARSPTRADWVHEIKADGYRLMARRDSVGVRLLTRNGHDWADRYPRRHDGGPPPQGQVLPDRRRSRGVRRARTGGVRAPAKPTVGATTCSSTPSTCWGSMDRPAARAAGDAQGDARAAQAQQRPQR
jgi:hypothetical protein